MLDVQYFELACIELAIGARQSQGVYIITVLLVSIGGAWNLGESVPFTDKTNEPDLQKAAVVHHAGTVPHEVYLVWSWYDHDFHPTPHFHQK